jgi:hypothetical protein
VLSGRDFHPFERHRHWSKGAESAHISCIHMRRRIPSRGTGPGWMVLSTVVPDPDIRVTNARAKTGMDSIFWVVRLHKAIEATWLGIANRPATKGNLGSSRRYGVFQLCEQSWKVLAVLRGGSRRWYFWVSVFAMIRPILGLAGHPEAAPELVWE